MPRKLQLPSALEIKHARCGYTASWTAQEFFERVKEIDNIWEKRKVEKPETVNFDDIVVYVPHLLGDKLIDEKVDQFKRTHKVDVDIERKKKKKQSGKALRQNEWWVAAQTVKLPKYKQLNFNFKHVQERRKHKKEKNSRIEANSITRMRKCASLMDVNRKKNFEGLEETVLIQVSIFCSKNSTLYGKKLRDVIFTCDHTLMDVKHMIKCLDGESGIEGSAFLVEDRFYAEGYEEDLTKNVPKIIQNWVSKRHRYQEAQLSPYDIVPMNSCKLGDLPIRLGAHYLYLHQGNCFHSIIFSDMRTLHNGDVKHRHAYPLCSFEMVHRVQLCGVCGKRPADLVTYNDILTPTSPFFFCRECFVGFHFDTKNKLIYKNFQVFHYKHD